MDVKKFEKWLSNTQSFAKSTVKNRSTNIKKIEKYYGDLDIAFNKDKCESILRALNYTVADEEQNQKAAHVIPIAGRIYTGTATYKLTLNLYINFKLFEIDEGIYENVDHIVSDVTVESDLKVNITALLNDFEYNKKLYKKKTDKLQVALFTYFNQNLSSYKWKIEHRPSESCRDSIDLYGFSEKEQFHIVIELDASRADQVAKKFVSRSSLFMNANVFYISVCYPGTEKMSKMECTKYFNYCAKLSDFISAHSPYKKLYLGCHLYP